MNLKSSYLPRTHASGCAFNTRRNGDNAAHAVMAAPRDRVSRFRRPAHEGTFLGSVLNSPDQAGTFITSQTCKGKPFHRGSGLPSSFSAGGGSAVGRATFTPQNEGVKLSGIQQRCIRERPPLMDVGHPFEILQRIRF